MSISAIYARVPPMQCKGLCVKSCMGFLPVLASGAEAMRIRLKWGSAPRWDEQLNRCTHLTVDGKCSIYEDRPLVCRLWGVMEGVKCRWGCVPEGGHLPSSEARKLISEMRTLEVETLKEAA